MGSNAPSLRGFSAVSGRRPRALILGSMPSVTSLAEAQYYGHPRNAFWPIMGHLLGFDPLRPYPDRLDALTKRGVALWDVVDQCDREASSDASIRNVRPNAILALVRTHPSLAVLALNGTKAAQLFRRHITPDLDSLADRDLTILELPSTSPAHAALSFEAKLERWRQLEPWLNSRA